MSSISKPTDVRVVGASVYFLPVRTRVPLKFGTETLTSATCARVCLRVRDRAGREAVGWGETPLSVQWVWPATSSYEARHEALQRFTAQLAEAWSRFDSIGHALEVGHDFVSSALPDLLAGFNRTAVVGGQSGISKARNDPPAVTPVSPHPACAAEAASARRRPGPLPGGEADTVSAAKSARGLNTTPTRDGSPPLPGGEGRGEGNRTDPSPKAQPSEDPPTGPMPWLAALVCCSPFDLALHDAFGRLAGRPVYQTYAREFLNRDLAAFLEPAGGADVSFTGRYPSEFLVASPPSRLRAWHLVGGLDLLDAFELTGREPADGYPVLLVDWIHRDGLKCLKVKLRGNDPGWDYERLVRVGTIALAHEVEWLTADFNCTVNDPAYVNGLLDRLRDEHPRLYGMILYVEQPFPYELEEHPIDAHSVSARKPLFLDESAHDWRQVRRGRELGWTGVALKTCKTQTGAILSACWARAHGMTLMVQDLTNPMLAQISHVLLAAHTGTIMGVETNAMQFYPEASQAEAVVHPGLYQRREGCVDLSSVRGPGFGYRLEEMQRELPKPVAAF